MNAPNVSWLPSLRPHGLAFLLGSGFITGAIHYTSLWTTLTVAIVVLTVLYWYRRAEPPSNPQTEPASDVAAANAIADNRVPDEQGAMR